MRVIVYQASDTSALSKNFTRQMPLRVYSADGGFGVGREDAGCSGKAG